MGRYDEALADLNRATELDADQDWAIADRGETFRAMGRYDEALADFNRAIELYPGDDDYIRKRAEIQRHIGPAEPTVLQTIGEQARGAVAPLSWCFVWWQVQGSNLGRRSRRFYRPLPLATRATCQVPPCGAAERRIADNTTGCDVDRPAPRHPRAADVTIG